MKLFSVSSSLNARAYSFYQRIQIQLFRTHPTRARFPMNRSVSSDSLYRRISHMGDPNVSIVPALDEWIGERSSVNKWEIQEVVKELMNSRRFRHTLEVSLWMTNKQRFAVAPFDIAVRLKLILKIFGLEQAEKYFHKIPENMRTYQIYLALLNCYTIAKSADKAESVMQKARDLGYADKPIWYNLLMNLYCQLGNTKKLGDLLIEMEAKGVSYDQFTYSVCLSACAMSSDAAGMDKVVTMMESDQVGVMHWRTWVIAAQGYLSIGLTDKALVIVDKLAKRLKATSKEENILSVFLLKLYAEAGKKSKLYQIWNLCKRKGNVANKVYIIMMRSLMKFSDIEGMEKIFENWKSSALSFDFRIPNFLIDAYCTDGHLEKAEALITKVMSKGGNPLVTTWCHLAGGYLKKNQLPEAVQSLKKAISACPSQFVSHKNSLIACLEYLEKGDCMEKAEEIIKSIRMRGISREAAPNEFCSFIKDGELQLSGDNQY